MKSLKGSLLIASPGLVDPNFARTVVFVAEHDAEGAFGLVLNRPGAATVAELWTSIAEGTCDWDAVTYTGGPVQQNAVLFLHGCPDLVPGVEPVVPGVFLGSELELLARVVARAGGGETAAGEGETGPGEGETGPGEGETGPGGGEEGAASRAEVLRVFCGYSGWGAGQLDKEMEAGGWLTLPARAEHVFEMPPEDLWSHALEAVGGVYRLFSLLPPKPELN